MFGYLGFRVCLNFWPWVSCVFNLFFQYNCKIPTCKLGVDFVCASDLHSFGWHRRGFLQIAMDEKVGVVPVYAFNENQVLFLSFSYCSILTGQMKGSDRLLILLAKTQKPCMLITSSEYCLRFRPPDNNLCFCSRLLNLKISRVLSLAWMHTPIWEITSVRRSLKCSDLKKPD
jgi:hypothetical protein